MSPKVPASYCVKLQRAFLSQDDLSVLVVLLNLILLFKFILQGEGSLVIRFSDTAPLVHHKTAQLLGLISILGFSSEAGKR